MTKLIVPRAVGTVTRQQVRALDRKSRKSRKIPTPGNLRVPKPGEKEKAWIAWQLRPEYRKGKEAMLEARRQAEFAQRILAPIHKPKPEPKKSEMGLWTP